MRIDFGDPAPRQAHRIPIAGRIYKIKSKSGNGFYDVHRLPDGRWTCQCLSFHYREDCSHVTEAQFLEAEELGRAG